MKLSAKLQNKSKEELIRELSKLKAENFQLQKELFKQGKELNFIGEISSLVGNDNLNLKEILQETVNLIPSGWQYPEITCARILLDNREYKTSNFKPSQWKQSESISIENKTNGVVEVFYIEEKPEEFEGPFLKEERTLLHIIAERLGKIATRKLLEEVFSVTFGESPVAKCIIDLDNENRFKDVNDIFLKFTGYTREEIIGKRPRQIGLFKNEKDIDKILNDVGKKGFIKNFEYDYVTKDGKVKSTILNTRVVHINGQNLSVASFIDLTERIKNEEKIRQSETRFQLIAKNVSDVIWMYNFTQNRYTYISPSIKKLRGFSPKEVMQQNLVASISPKDRDRIAHLVKENVHRFEKDNVPRSFVKEFQLVHKDGSLIWGEISTYLQKNNKGEIEIFGVSRNIDERKRAELKAEEQRRQLNSALKIAGLGYYIISGSDANVDFIDAQTKDILGFNENTKKASLQNWLNNVHPEDRDKVMIVHKELYNGKKETSSLVYKYNHPSKGLIWIKHNTEVLQKNENHQTLKIFGVIQDITELKRKESELIKAKQKAEESETQLKASQALAKLGSWELDVDSGMFTFNDNFYKIFKTTAEEVGGYQMTIKEYTDRFVYSDDYNRVEEESRNAIETDDPNYAKYLEHRIRYNDGSTGYIGVRLFIKKDSNGRTVKTYGVNQDITERKLIEEELTKSKEKAEESDRLKSSFLMNVSHEIRTPMNGILGFIDLMNEPDLDEEERRSFIDIVNKSGERLLNTINDIVEISKIEIGDIKLVTEEVDVEEIMRYHFNFFKLQANEKGIKLKMSKLIKGKQAIVETDKKKLDGILMNLIRNAMKFTSKGTIEIGNYIENDRFYFYVSDSGRGIPEDKLETIFDRFVQVELGNTRGYEGSGIGLSIVKAYIEALDGDIIVKSELGKGSTFLFSLPYSPVNLKSKIIGKAMNDNNYPLKQTVLIAEDDEVNYYFLENILSKEFKLLHATNGEDAIKLFHENEDISLVLMDIKMPGEYDGFDTTRKIRKINQQIPIIAQTAYAMESDKIKALDAGCNDYISKPYSPGNLKSLIRKYCKTIEKNKTDV